MTVNIFTVPPGAPFLPSLARAVLNGDLPRGGGAKPALLDLPSITLLLPTARAARAAQEAFLDAAGARALLMPVIRPISEQDEDANLIETLARIGPSGADALNLAPAMTPLRRMLTLMQLVQRWRAALARGDDIAPINRSTPAQSANLAAELAKLMDDVEREGASLANLEQLVPDGYSEHWRQTVDFLKIVTEAWPAHLEELGLSSPRARVTAMILAEAERISRLPPETPVIVAGVTGSVPATVALMRAVAARASGGIVLPALDDKLDDESWDVITPCHPEHPQHGLKTLLDRLGVARRDVKTLPGAAISPQLEIRAAFVSEAMRPAATTARWRAYATGTDATAVRQALAGVSLIKAPGSQDEAEAIALILREAVETPGRTAALVSPDRVLARRVAIRLAAWGIRVDDSAGRPIDKTVPGAFLSLVADAVHSGFAPAETMSLLKHPLCRIEYSAFDIRRFGRAMEIAAFRKPYLGRGLDGVISALEKSESDRLQKKRQSAAAERLWDEDRAGALDVAHRLKAAFAPLAVLSGVGGSIGLKAVVTAHIAAAEALAAIPAEDGGEPAANPLWQGTAGEHINSFLRDLLEDDTPDVAISIGDYADLYASLTARENVREHASAHPRVSIWGRFEARLQQPDVLILGSLNEGVWPETAEPGAWLNRPMRQALGLPAPEASIGQSAHDFTSLLGAEQVVLTRAEKIKGVPAVPSRWLMRIEALLDGMGLKDALEAPRPWLAWARARDAIDEARRVRIQAPAPKPPVEMRPRRMSVTRVEEWIRNPYAVFARQILKLEPLPPLGAAPDAALRGALVHEALSQFAVANPVHLPDDMRRELDCIAASVLESYTGHPRIAAFWMPRLARFLDWFAATEAERREGVVRVVAETSGSLVVAAPAGPFVITARADRIDEGRGGLTITDYKTGSLPGDRVVSTGRSPQLPLEAAIALGEVGFPGTSSRAVAALRYIRASGGEPPGEEKYIKCESVAGLAAAALTGLAELVAKFDSAETPYRAIRRPGFRYDFDDYAHLARVAEWSAHVDDEAAP
ncbi:MAG: double-strand break repair protein AddB [Hyphomicrobium sp.]